MFFPAARVRVYLYGQPVDMRRSFNGLYALARARFAGEPTGVDLYMFVNRRGTQMKVRYFDHSGWCVWAKRLEAGVFISDWQRAQTQEIDSMPSRAWSVSLPGWTSNSPGRTRCPATASRGR
jgi:transposase